MSVITGRYAFSGAGEDFGVRKDRRLVILHTFESAPDKNTMRDAIAGAIWQDRNDVLGSYNRLVAVDGVLGCVPDAHISGGVNPGSQYFAPRPWLYSQLPASVVNDPNSYALQLCAMGNRAWYDANGWPGAIIDGFARSILEEEAAADDPIVVANHADFQPGNRSDAGAIAHDLVMKRVAALRGLPDTAMEVDDLMARAWRPQTVTWTTRRGGSFTAAGVKKAFTAAVPIRTFLEEIEVLPDGTIETPMDRRFLAAYPDPLTGPEVLVIPRKSLTDPRDVKNSLPGGGLTQADVDKQVRAAMRAFNKNLDVWVAQRPHD